MAEIYAVKLFPKTKSPELYRSVSSHISQEKQERIKRFRKWEDAERALIGEVLIRTIVCNQFNLNNNEIIFRKNQYGKPFLKDFSNFHFNISHSGEWVVCAIDNVPVGVDIEQIKSIDFSIARRFFSWEEYADLFAKEDHERLGYFFDLWTLKESFVKAVGKGLSIPLNSFSIKIGDRRNIQIGIPKESKNYYFKLYNIDRDYRLSICSANHLLPNHVVIKDYDEVLEEFLAKAMLRYPSS